MTDDFIRQHATKFMLAASSQADLVHPVEWTVIYQEYLNIFESNIMAFVGQHGGNVEVNGSYHACLNTVLPFLL
jgi:hypothetical protein